MLFILVGMLPLAGSGFSAVHAQTDTSQVYYPQTGHFLGGEFRVFFEQHGGVRAFGYPVTDQYIRSWDSRIVQYFERARIERVDEPGQPPYLKLGDIGTDYARLRGYSFPRVPPVSDTRTRRYFPETGHTMEGVFKFYWDRNNGAFYFGAPISERVAEVFPDGQQKVVQYFERARLELEADGQTISRGLIGTALAPCQQKFPRPQNLPPSGPGIEGDSSECNNPQNIVMGRVFPAVTLPGARLGFEAINFEPGEKVSLWLNLPDLSVRSLPYQAVADENGYVLIGVDTRPDDPLGTWSIVGSGIKSDRLLVAPFVLTR
jgi:hypothetical protein